MDDQGHGGDDGFDSFDLFFPVSVRGSWECGRGSSLLLPQDQIRAFFHSPFRLFDSFGLYRYGEGLAECGSGCVGCDTAVCAQAHAVGSSGRGEVGSIGDEDCSSASQSIDALHDGFEQCPAGRTFCLGDVQQHGLRSLSDGLFGSFDGLFHAFVFRPSFVRILFVSKVDLDGLHGEWHGQSQPSIVPGQSRIFVVVPWVWFLFRSTTFVSRTDPPSFPGPVLLVLVDHPSSSTFVSFGPRDGSPWTWQVPVVSHGRRPFHHPRLSEVGSKGMGTFPIGDRGMVKVDAPSVFDHPNPTREGLLSETGSFCFSPLPFRSIDRSIEGTETHRPRGERKDPHARPRGRRTVKTKGGGA
eukprot:scaffold1639_cov331-Pavlova_lutheri.AAC.7